MCQEHQQACGTELGVRSARGMAEAFTNKRAKRAERRESEWTDSSGWLKRLARADCQRPSSNGFGSSGWLKRLAQADGSRGRLLGADANGRARQWQKEGGPPSLPAPPLWGQRRGGDARAGQTSHTHTRTHKV